jgi:hypothetical protein
MASFPHSLIGLSPFTILANITHRQWADFWIKSKEETSSSRSGQHFGHYIAEASSNIISHFHVVKTSIVLKQGISLEHWSQGLVVKHEMAKGCSLVSKLRSILLMAGAIIKPSPADQTNCKMR